MATSPLQPGAAPANASVRAPSDAWQAALVAFQRITEVAHSIDSDRYEAAFDTAASIQLEHAETLLAVPAPDLAGVAVKLRIIAQEGVHGMVEHVLADVERLSSGDERVVESLLLPAHWGEHVEGMYVLPKVFPGVGPDMQAAANAYLLAYHSKSGSAGKMVTAAAGDIARVSARTGPDLAAKVLLGAVECNPALVDERLAIDLSSFSTDAAAAILIGAAHDAAAMVPVAEDEKLVGAFQAFCAAAREMAAAPEGPDRRKVEDYFYLRMDPADMVLKTTPALTPAGVAMKLKRVFAELVSESWSDDAPFDDRPADFMEHVQRSGLYQEMFWRAIEDLDRMSTGGR